MQETTNKKLKKIELTDAPPDITVLNNNWDKIDDELQTSTEHNNNGDIHVTATDKTNWNSKAAGSHNHNAAYAPISHSNNGDIHVTATDKTNWNAKANGSHNHSAADITSGTLGAARGGTGRATLTANYFLRGNGTGAVGLSSPATVRSDIGAAPSGYGLGENVYNNRITNPLDRTLKTGVYGFSTYVDTVQNSPQTNFLGHIEVYALSDTWHYVVAVNHDSGEQLINRYDGNNNKWTGWKQIESYRVLYSSTSGKNTGTITLAETAANYKHLRIYYQRDGQYSSVDVFEPNNKDINLQWNTINDTGIFVCCGIVRISGTSVTFATNRDWWLTWGNSIGGATNRLWIMRIEGYI